MRTTWRPSPGVQRYLKNKLNSSKIEEGTGSSGLLPSLQDEDDEVFFRMTRFENKMKVADDRYTEKK
jgi:hypothetical protein